MKDRDRTKAFAELDCIKNIADRAIDATSPRDAFMAVMNSIRLEITDEELSAAIDLAYERNAKALSCEAA